jgi:hypothetical protein
MHRPTPPAVTLVDGAERPLQRRLAVARRWPAANRCTMKSPAVVPACSRPSGGNTRSRMAALIDVPVTTSMTRPAMLNPALL